MGTDFDLLAVIAVAAAWGAGALGTYALVNALLLMRQNSSGAALQEIVVNESRSAVVRAFLPLAGRIGRGLRGILSPGAREEGKPGLYPMLHEGIQRQLGSAGFPEGLNADEYVGFTGLCMLLGGALGVLVFLLFQPLDVFWLFFLGLAAGGIWMPRWLKARREARHAAIRRDLPFSLDLLTLAMEAGLDFTSGLDRICQKLGRSPLGEEFQVLLSEIRLGKQRATALRDLARRVDVSEVQSVVATLVQTEEMGSNISTVFRILAAQQRESRSQRAEEAAGKLPVKMLLPLVLMLMVTFLVIFGPLALWWLG
ncbi:MAG: type II secretion system F family protein [Planctomycetota bacterium]